MYRISALRGQSKECAMYHLFVRRFARRTFERLTAGNWQSVLEDLSPDIHHVYAGKNAVGGTRTSRDDVRLWFERVYRLFPSFHEEVREVLVGGWPWNTVAAVQWVATTPPNEFRPRSWYRRAGPARECFATLAEPG